MIIQNELHNIHTKVHTFLSLKSIILFNLFPSINEYQVKQNEILIYSNFHILVTLLTVLSFYDKN